MKKLWHGVALLDTLYPDGVWRVDTQEGAFLASSEEEAKGVLYNAAVKWKPKSKVLVIYAHLVEESLVLEAARLLQNRES